MSTKKSDPSMAMVELTVTDSGKGISQAYMGNKMFTSFSQKNVLAPGINFLQRDLFSLSDYFRNWSWAIFGWTFFQMMDGEIEVRAKQSRYIKVPSPHPRAPKSKPNTPNPVSLAPKSQQP